MAVTPEIQESILRAYRQNPRRFSPSKVSKAEGVHINEVFAVIEANRERIDQNAEVHGGFGRPELREHLVSRRRAMAAPWDNTLPEIAAARADYEAGTHEMATGRDGPWLILYSIPRTRPGKTRPGYFLPENA